MKKEVIKNKYNGVEYNPFIDSYTDTYIQEKEVVEVAPEVHKKQIYYTNCKIIKSGNVIEVFNYTNGVYRNYECNTSVGKTKTDSLKRFDNINRAKNNLRRIINSNVTGRDTFLTLTFKDNFSDLVQAKIYFKRFIQQMKRYGFNLKYCYVVEFQKRGAIHFHVILFNSGFIDVHIIEKAWKHGFIKINHIDNVDNVGAYVVKYMNKDMNDGRLKNCDLYGRSRGLKKPIETNNPQEVAGLLEGLSNNLVYSNTYSNDYKGTCVYCQFNKKRVINNKE